MFPPERLTGHTDTLQGEQLVEGEAQEESWLQERKTTLWEEKCLQPPVTFGICKGSSYRQEITAGLTYK